MQFKTAVNDKHTFQIDTEKALQLDVVKVNEQLYHLIHEHQTQSVQLVSADYANKKMVFKINNRLYDVEVKDNYDLLLESMGMNKNNQNKVNNLKAPMPGLVLKISTQVGDDVKKGDTLMILEAMKMENVIKSPADVKVKKICINERDAVEKNQILFEFD